MPVPPAPPVIKDEPLECVIKEHKRDEHLKNLGMKRNKSIRKSIAKKLRKRDKKDETDGENKENLEVKETKDVKEVKDSNDFVKEVKRERREFKSVPRPVQLETRTSIGSRVEGGTKVEIIQVEKKKEKDLVGETQPLPGYIENDVPKKMDKLRRSFRQDNQTFNQPIYFGFSIHKG